MNTVDSFKPADGCTKSINVGAASARVAMTFCAGDQAIRIHNAGTATVWIKGGGSTVAAVAADDIPIGPGATEVLTFSVPNAGTLYMAAIAAGATGYIYFTPGDGI